MMRCLKRNKQKIWFANYIGVTEEKDGDGYYTGDNSIEYTEPIEAYVNVSSISGYSDTELFGRDIRYDRILTYDSFNVAKSITEYSILWIETEPTKNGEPQSHDYVVNRVARSCEGAAFTVAISRVNRDES